MQNSNGGQVHLPIGRSGAGSSAAGTHEEARRPEGSQSAAWSPLLGGGVNPAGAPGSANGAKPAIRQARIPTALRDAHHPLPHRKPPACLRWCLIPTNHKICQPEQAGIRRVEKEEAPETQAPPGLFLSFVKERAYSALSPN
jgi:hypothetical protein